MATAEAQHFTAAVSSYLVADYPVTLMGISASGGDVSIYDEGTVLVWKQPNGQVATELNIAMNKLLMTSVGSASIAYF